MTENQTAADGSQSGDTQAGASGDSDFERLISSFDEPVKTEPNRSEPSIKDVLKAIKPVVDFANGERTTRETAAVEKSIGEIVDYMTEPDETKELPKRFVRGFLAEYSREHPDIQKSYQERSTNPTAWKAVLEQARTELLNDAKSLPRDKVASDVRAAKAAVQGTTQKAAKTDDGPSVMEMANMSNHDWEQYKASLEAGAARK